MLLHQNRELFNTLMVKTANHLDIDVSYIEKDYLLTQFLYELTKLNPKIIFKGGTSLSKCYHVIQRFSEDIDLNIEYDQKANEGQRWRLKKDILSVIETLQLELTNADHVRSRRDFNCYAIAYPSIYPNEFLKAQIYVETAVFLPAFPVNRMKMNSFIFDYLSQTDQWKIISEYALEPFELSVQSLERTVIDKLFALGDYICTQRENPISFAPFI